MSISRLKMSLGAYMLRFRNFKYNDVHVKGALKLAQMAEALGVSRFVHVSHLNADINSPSAFLRSKAEGESVVKKAFEGATIVRPGNLYGHEDRLLNQMASECNRVRNKFIVV